MTAVLCTCGHPKGRHLLGQRDCRSCPGCDAFTAAAAGSVALDVTALLAEVQGDADREAELAARLAEAERERDSARHELEALLGQAEPVYDEHVRHLCPVCGGRYRETHNHPCGPLVPVRVRITFIDP